MQHIWPWGYPGFFYSAIKCCQTAICESRIKWNLIGELPQSPQFGVQFVLRRILYHLSSQATRLIITKVFSIRIEVYMTNPLHDFFSFRHAINTESRAFHSYVQTLQPRLIAWYWYAVYPRLSILIVQQTSRTFPSSLRLSRS